jgi:hypothetical protein
MKDAEHDTIECTWLRSEPATCGLLQQLTGLTDRKHCTVNRDACLACVRWYTPSEDHLNPVVASLLYTLSSKIAQSGGMSGCSATRAIELGDFALVSIPNDFDAIPVADHVDGQYNTNVTDIGRLVPRPPSRYGPRVQEWAVAVTTTPRKQATLDRCLDSLIATGWTSPRIIADGDVAISAKWNHLPMTQRTPQIGAWPSYYLTLIELMMRQPHADAYMIVQDDVVMFRHSDLRVYLESILWPDQRPGIVSLFCSRAYAQSNPGWHKLEKNLVWGGPALIFSQEAAIQVVSDLQVVRHRFQGERGLANIDGLIGAWAWETETPVFVSTPSLSQHIGHVSSLWRTPRAFINRSASDFAGNQLPIDARSKTPPGTIE